MRRGAADPRRQAAERHGRHAEWIALLSLMMKGYRPLARRARTPLGEIDLIVRRGKVTVMVEVKARRDHDAALMAVTPRQRERLNRAAEWWLAKNPAFAEDDVRFDLVLVAPGRWPSHLKNAFSP